MGNVLGLYRRIGHARAIGASNSASSPTLGDGTATAALSSSASVLGDGTTAAALSLSAPTFGAPSAPAMDVGAGGFILYYAQRR
jgi:hypothetical protein